MCNLTQLQLLSLPRFRLRPPRIVRPLTPPSPQTPLPQTTCLQYPNHPPAEKRRTHSPLSRLSTVPLPFPLPWRRPPLWRRLILLPMVTPAPQLPPEPAYRDPAKETCTLFTVVRTIQSDVPLLDS
ncbi:hypothetical protein GY45DRAFT_390790 [Cubamyces sp. BRFM 1775]|nr:hypothetical protein GY45DRAFT_390790 [Cubamyces sp. BRFM 1775]